MPDLTPALTLHETPHIKEDLPAAVKDLDLKVRWATPLRSLDLDKYFQIGHSSRPRENQSQLYPIITTTVCACIIDLLLGYILRYRLCPLYYKGPSNDPPESNQVPQPSPRTVTPEYATLSTKKDQHSECVMFTNYALQATQ